MGLDAIQELVIILKERPFFALFEDEEISEILSFAIVGHYTFGKFVFKEGEKANFFYIVFSGSLKMVKNVAGKEISLKTIIEGELFGEQCIIDNKPHTSSVISSSDSMLIQLPKKKFIKYIENKPHAVSYIKDYIQNLELNNFIRLGTHFGRKVPLKYLTVLIQNLKEEHFKEKTKIVREGEIGDKFYIIREGYCEVFKINEHGERVSIVKLEKGGHFGELALIQNEPRNATIIALTDCVLLTLNKDQFLEFHKIPAVTKIFKENITHYSLLDEYKLKVSVEDNISTQTVNIEKLIQESVAKFQDRAKEEDDEEQLKFQKKDEQIKNFPIVYQHDITDCGAACLAMVCKFYGKRVSLSYLRDITNITYDGASMLSVADAAEKMGFLTRGVNLGKDGLKEVLLPAICHWGGYHWLVVYAVKQETVYVADPDMGKTKYSYEDFMKSWSQIALLVEPSPKFTTKSIGKSSIKQFIPVVYEYKPLIFEVFLTTLILAVFGLASPFFTQTIVDEILVHHDKRLLYLMLLGMIILFVFQTILTILRSYLSFHISTRINLKLFVNFFKYLCSLPLIFFKNRRIGDITARFDENKKIQKFLMSNSVNLIIDIISMIIYCLVMFHYSTKLTTVFLIFILFIVIVTILVTPKIKRMTNDIFHASADQQSQLIETMHGIDTIKSMSLEIPRRWEWENKYIKQLHYTYRHFKWETVLRVANSSLSFASTITILYLGALLVADGKMSVGQLMAFNGLTGAVLQPLNHLINLWDDIQEVKVAVDRLSDVFNSEPEMTTEKNQIVQLTYIDGLVEFDRIHFRYGKGDAPYVVKNFNLTVYPGQKIAIVGRSGSGKTTLIKMIPKLLSPTEGSIRIDGIDINALDTSFLRSNIGYVLQDSYIFSGTFYENIAMNRYWVTSEITTRAAKLASAHDFISRFPNGYNTMIGENGVSLSGGQKQRIAIARQLVGNPKIFIMDEATSSLDTETEKAIQSSLQEILHNKTAFIIAHRLSTIKNADLIVVLEEGEIIEMGKHEELMKNEDLYYHLNTNQLGVN